MRMVRGLTRAVGLLAWLTLAAALLLSVGDVVLAPAEAAPAVAEDQRLLPNVKPSLLIDIGGRRINLQCTGAGGPTVILMAGSASWSPIWLLTPALVADLSPLTKNGYVRAALASSRARCGIARDFI
jgi:hypothetical protein